MSGLSEQKMVAPIQGSAAYSEIWSNWNPATVADGLVRYIAFGSSQAYVADETTGQNVVTRAGTIVALGLSIGVTLDVSATITVRKNTADTALATTKSATERSIVVTGAVPVDVGDLISIEVDTTASSSGVITIVDCSLGMVF